uniref:AT-hook motif nuclear-localized protein n=1 Tax=Antirrhinum majus TaxID=4151 RepID=Q9ZRR7_ANTMA|nr:SAP1 protein [Antirrhinum majus]
MEQPNNDGNNGGSCYRPQLPNQSPPANGVPNSTTTNSTHSPPNESVKRKRGRPRKYGTPEQAAAAKRLSAPKKRDSASGVASVSSASSKKSPLAALGNMGQSFSPHIITVAAGEDVGQKIMMFVQQSKREICVISASGSVSSASLRQQASSGGSVTYEGRFDILSLSGSFIHAEFGGRTGGLSVCLSSSDGQIIGGGVGGPLTAAATIQVIVGTFVVETKKDANVEAAASGKSPSPNGGASAPGLSFRSPADSGIQMGGGGNPFLIQNRTMHMTPMEWIGSADHGMHQSPENGDYDHIPD